MKKVLFSIALSFVSAFACHKPQYTSSAIVLDAGVSKQSSPRSEFSPIFFAFDRSDLSYESMLALDSLVAFMVANPTTHVLISGHANDKDTEVHNLELGQKRAEAVARYLLLHRIAPERIKTLSRGEEVPSEDPALSNNGRAELALYTPNSHVPKKEIRLSPIPEFKFPSFQGL